MILKRFVANMWKSNCKIHISNFDILDVKVGGVVVVVVAVVVVIVAAVVVAVVAPILVRTL